MVTMRTIPFLASGLETLMADSLADAKEKLLEAYERHKRQIHYPMGWQGLVRISRSMRYHVGQLVIHSGTLENITGEVKVYRVNRVTPFDVTLAPEHELCDRDGNLVRDLDLINNDEVKLELALEEILNVLPDLNDEVWREAEEGTFAYVMKQMVEAVQGIAKGALDGS